MGKYKAIIFDLDGTVIPNKRESLPSQLVTEAIQKAHKHIIISAATGRPFWLCENVLNTLLITAPCIVDGGSQIINPVNKEILYEKKISVKSIQRVLTLLRALPRYHEIVNTNDIPYSTPQKVQEETGMVCLFGASGLEAEDILKKLQVVPDITAHTAQSWKKGFVDIHISHAQANKEHAVKKLLTMINVPKTDVIGVGDSDNDIPIFNAVGFKIAMGNATERLKQQADYIAPSIDEDGVIHIVEKFILH